MMFLLLRNIPIQTERLKSNQWREKSYIGAELRDKKIGLVGCGAVGKTLATKLQVFGPKIYGYDPFVDAQTMSNFSIEKCEFLDLLSIADVVSLQLTLNANTRNMIGKEELMRMKKSAVLINVSRGELVKENDLIWALENGIIAGAALDVFVDEPHVNQALLNIPNLILTPHIAGFTKEANVQMAMGAVENMLRVSV
jgi:D-3-phosphoglycerate dehydrogenase